MYNFYVIQWNVQVVSYYLCEGCFVFLFVGMSFGKYIDFVGWLYFYLIDFVQIGLGVEGIYYC